jgi:DNA replication and repair protein RecF
MFVTEVTLSDFRNYERERVELSSGRNILIGENAQGKTNFLEAIELVANGDSDRVSRDFELIRKQSRSMEIKLVFKRQDRTERLRIFWQLADSISRGRDNAVEKSADVNGVLQTRTKEWQRRLCTVSFKSTDLNLLRGGPKYRRNWIDRISIYLKPSVSALLAKHSKIISQRNRLLKTLFEKGSVSTSARDELKIWDEQAALYGARLILSRTQALLALQPHARKFLAALSDSHELIETNYLIKLKDSSEGDWLEDTGADQSATRRDDLGAENGREALPERIRQAHLNEIGQMSETELAETLANRYRSHRYEEISRRQTLYGPHRDDLSFSINGKDAIIYASQGQQRSLVLALKLAELRLLSEQLEDTPVLILDDVLAELDLSRQRLLMSLVNDDMQTIISTTHLSGIPPTWLKDAQIFVVKNGRIEQKTEPADALLADCGATANNQADYAR